MYTNINWELNVVSSIHANRYDKKDDALEVIINNNNNNKKWY